MGFINFLVGVANGPHEVATRLAACFALLICGLSAIGGVAIIVNGLYHTAQRLSHERRISAYRAQRRNNFGL